MVISYAQRVCVTFLFFILASIPLVSSSMVEPDHIIRLRKTNKTSLNSRSNIVKETGLNMDLTKAILVHQVDSPNLICYNSTFPYLASICDPGNGDYCSIESPTFGCTKESSKSCNDYHLCNLPHEMFISVVIFCAIILLIITTGCLWCCCCCCCGKCCKGCCPWFAKLQMQTTVITYPNRVYPMPPPDNDWSMYGYGGSKTPDTLIAEPRKHARRENMRKEYAENSDFPPPPPHPFPTAPQMCNSDPEFGYHSALHTVPVYTSPRHENINKMD